MAHMAMDRGETILRIALDIYDVFDPVVQSTIHKRLHTSFCVYGNIMSRFKSFLSELLQTH